MSELAQRGVDVDRPLLVRHHLRLPNQAAVARARQLVAEEGYRLVMESGATGWTGRASRTQLVTGLSLAQERNRMAGLAQRLGGEAEGWDVCGPAET